MKINVPVEAKESPIFLALTEKFLSCNNFVVPSIRTRGATFCDSLVSIPAPKIATLLAFNCCSIVYTKTLIHQK